MPLKWKTFKKVTFLHKKIEKAKKLNIIDGILTFLEF